MTRPSRCTLVEHRVRFVLFGGFAAALRGSPVITGDVDICYARDAENLRALARALGRLRARSSTAEGVEASRMEPGGRARLRPG